MRYPHQWEASADVWCSSSKTKGKDREYALAMHVHRPGTPDHTRRVIARLSYGELLKVYEQIKSQLAHIDDDVEGGLTT